MNDGGTRIDGRSHLADDSPVIEARVFFGAAPVPMPDIATLTDEDGRFSLWLRSRRLRDRLPRRWSGTRPRLTSTWTERLAKSR